MEGGTNVNEYWKAEAVLNRKARIRAILVIGYLIIGLFLCKIFVFPNGDVFPPPTTMMPRFTQVAP